MRNLFKYICLSVAILFSTNSLFAQALEEISFVWKGADAKSFSIEATAGKSFSVDWGNGNTTIHTGMGAVEVVPSQAYANNNNYTVTVSALSNDCLFSILTVYNKEISSLDLSKAVSLQRLDCSGNELTSLDLSNNNALISVGCDRNHLSLANLNVISQKISSTSNKFLGRQTLPQITTVLSTSILFDGVFNGMGTTFAVKKYGKPLAEGSDYAIAGGYITFFVAGVYEIEITNTSVTSDYTYPAVVAMTVVAGTVNIQEISFTWKGETAKDISVSMASAKTVIVDWGDGSTPENHTDANIPLSHAYADNNDYTVTIKGEDIFCYFTSLVVNNSEIHSIDVTKALSLEALDCSNNVLTTLDLSKNSLLENLSCINNQFRLGQLHAASQRISSVSNKNLGTQVIPGRDTLNINDATIVDNYFNGTNTTFNAYIFNNNNGLWEPAGNDNYSVVGGGAIRLKTPGNYKIETSNTAITSNVAHPAKVVTEYYVRSNDATLSNISLSGSVSLVPDFAPNITNYTASVANNITSIDVTGTVTHTAATITGNGVKTLVVGNNSVTLTVKAEDGTTTKTYTVVIHRAPSSDASLSSLTINPYSERLQPAFTPAVTTYDVYVENHVDQLLSVTGVATHPNATVSGNGGPKLLPLLDPNINTITITVTAEDGVTTQNYLIRVKRDGVAVSQDATLSSLTVSEGVLSPSFAPNTMNYTVNVATGISSINVAGVANDPKSTVEGNGTHALVEGANSITIKVIAENLSVRTYYIMVNRTVRTPGAESDLLELKINNNLIDISTTSLSYVADCGETSAQLQMVVSPYAKVYINGHEFTGQPIALSKAVETIDLRVQSEAGTSNQTYTLKITSPLNGNNLYYQRWDNVLAINNNIENNGGHEIVGHRWYENGSDIVLSTEAFIRISGNASKYYAEIKLKETGEWHKVCGTPSSGGTSAAQVIAYPSPISQGEILKLQISEEMVGGYLNVYSVSGMLLKSRIPLLETLNNIDISAFGKGINLLHIVGKDKSTHSLKVVVN